MIFLQSIYIDLIKGFGTKFWELQQILKKTKDFNSQKYCDYKNKDKTTEQMNLCIENMSSQKLASLM